MYIWENDKKKKIEAVKKIVFEGPILFVRGWKGPPAREVQGGPNPVSL